MSTWRSSLLLLVMHAIRPVDQIAMLASGTDRQT